MTCDLLIRGGMVVSSQGIHRADVAIVGGKIASVGDLRGASARETIDARNLHVLPGGIDTQVHFREPGMEHKEDLESGTRAALFGGVTTVFEMPNTQPATTSLAALQDKVARAAGRTWCHTSFFVGATTDNAEELAALEFAPGTPGIKVFVGSSTGTLLVERDEDIERVLRHGKRRCPIHAEDEARLRERKSLLGESPHAREHPNVRDAEAARLATSRVLGLSEKAGRPVHILHVSTLDELPLLAEAKERGLGTTCEVTPQHLTFSSEDYERLGTRLQMNPPVRAKEHREALWRALQDGLFDVFGSDHAPHTSEEKALPYPSSPSGMPGVQTILPVLLGFVAQGRLSLQAVVRMLCENPALIYGVRDKGFVASGYDADLVLLDPDQSFVVEQGWLQSKCGWSPYEGSTLRGKPVHVLVGGRWSLREGALQGSPAGRSVEFGWK